MPAGSSPKRERQYEHIKDSLKKRGKAAHSLQQDLLTEVPLLYGSPGGMEPQGDPGIVLARLHQEEMQRRNGGGVPRSLRKRSDVAFLTRGRRPPWRSRSSC